MGCGCGCGGRNSRLENIVRQSVQKTLQEDGEQLSDVDVEEGKMSDILGVPEDEDIGEAYDGSAKDATQELVDAVGEDEAASMINYAANISGDEFLEDMQDALKNDEKNETMKRKAIRNLVREALNEVIQEEDNYQQFVQSTMDKLGIDDPQDLTDDGRSKFFDMIGSRYNEDEDEIEDEISDEDLADLFEPEDFAEDAPDLVKNESLTERVAKRAARRLVRKINQ